MHRAELALVLAVMGWPAWGATVESVANPRARGAWITDGADVLDAAAEARVEALAEGLHRDIGVELAVVTLDSVDGTPKEFATALFNHWGIGDAAHDNGLLVLLVLGERRLEMEVGIGLEDSLPNDWLGTMQATSMVPRFKAGDFGGGVEAGVQAVDTRLRSAPGEAAVAPSEAPVAVRVEAPVPPSGVSKRDAVRHEPAPRPAPSRRSPLWWLFGVLGMATVGGVLVLAGLASGVIAVPVALVRWWNKCPACGGPTELLDDLADDAHLDAGQRAEERVRSVDWRVRICLDCQQTRITPHYRWWSGYQTCPSCRRVTARATTKTLVEATTTHGGEVEYTLNCVNCGHASTEVVKTPQRVPTPDGQTHTWNTVHSSGGSGHSHGGSSSPASHHDSSGGFGGGHSRGGGTGSSW